MDCRMHLAQLEPTLGNLDVNLAMHAEAAKNAASQGADCVLFGELSLTGYFLKRHVFTFRQNGEPAARTRLIDRLKHLATISCS